MLNLLPVKNLESLKKHIKINWDSIPKVSFQNNIKYIKYL